VDKEVFFFFAGKFANKEKLDYKVWDHFNHSCCWESAWDTLLEQIGA
jgi:hypothetical protein